MRKINGKHLCRSLFLIELQAVGRQLSGLSVCLLVLPLYFQYSIFADKPRVGAMKFEDHNTCTISRARGVL